MEMVTPNDDRELIEKLLEGYSLRTYMIPDSEIPSNHPEHLETLDLPHVVIVGNRFWAKSETAHLVRSTGMDYGGNNAFCYTNRGDVYCSYNPMKGEGRAFRKERYKEHSWVLWNNYKLVWDSDGNQSTAAVKEEIQKCSKFRVALLDPEDVWNIHPVDLPMYETLSGRFQLKTALDFYPVFFRSREHDGETSEIQDTVDRIARGDREQIISFEVGTFPTFYSLYSDGTYYNYYDIERSTQKNIIDCWYSRKVVRIIPMPRLIFNIRCREFSVRRQRGPRDRRRIQGSGVPLLFAIAFALYACQIASPADGEKTAQVSFEVYNPAPPPRIFKIPAGLLIPKGVEGKVPAVVILHGGRGNDGTGAAYAAALHAAGIATLELDLFGPRQQKSRGYLERRQFLPDVFGALGFLANHPTIDGARIGVIEFSWSGGLAIMTAIENYIRYHYDGETRFAAHVALYPMCHHFQEGGPLADASKGAWTGAPVLILAAELDDYEAPNTCPRFARELPKRSESPFPYLFTWTQLTASTVPTARVSISIGSPILGREATSNRSRIRARRKTLGSGPLNSFARLSGWISRPRGTESPGQRPATAFPGNDLPAQAAFRNSLLT